MGDCVLKTNLHNLPYGHQPEKVVVNIGTKTRFFVYGSDRFQITFDNSGQNKAFLKIEIILLICIKFF